MKIALIGCGAAAERYYIPALKNYPEIIKELFIVDRDLERARNVASILGNGKIIEDYKSIQGEVQGAIIALPNFLHYAVGLDLLRSKVHVLCEKPLADSHEQAVEMVAAANENGVVLCVNHTRRMFPSNQSIRKILSEQQLGRVKSIRYMEGSTFGWASATGFYANPKMGSKGLLSDLGPHVIDTLSRWLGAELNLIDFTDDSFGGPESVAKIEAEYNGYPIEIFLNRLVDLESNYSIECERGLISGKPMDWENYTIRYPNGDVKNIRISCPQKNYPAFIVPIFDNFIKSINGKAAPLISGEDVLPSISFIDQCYQKRKRFTMPWYDNIKVASIPKQETVLVTGATGFIGATIAERMYLSEEKKIKAVVHNWANAARLGRFPMEIVEMDLLDENSIKKALEGVTAVVHCAKGPYDVTVNGTDNLIKAASEKGIDRFVHLSTTEVYGNREGTISEETPFEYTGNEYNRMKIDAEKVCLRYREKGLPITILRPSIVYGPFSKNWTLNFAKLLKDRKIGVFEEIGEGKCNLIYVQDLINAAMRCLDNPNAAGETFNVSGPQIILWNEYFELFNRALRLPKIKVIKKNEADLKTAVLTPVRKIGGYARDHFMEPIKKIAESVSIADVILRKIEKTLKTNLAADELKLLNKKAIYSTENAKKKLGFYPSTSVEDGIEKSVQWLKHNLIF